MPRTSCFGCKKANEPEAKEPEADALGAEEPETELAAEEPEAEPAAEELEAEEPEAEKQK